MQSPRLASRTSAPLALTLLAALAVPTAHGRAQEVTPPTPPAAAPQDPGPAKDPAEDEKGFIPLFNGKDLTGWTPKIRGYPAGENFGNTFRVVEGVLQVGYEKYESFDARFGHLFHEAEFSSYILRLDYRFIGEQAKDGAGWAFRNSGIMVHGQTPASMRVDQDFPVSIEVQLLGGDGEHDRTTGNLCTPGTNVELDGKLERRHCTNSRSKTYHGDQWVSVEVEVHGSELIRHKINGEVVLEYRAPQLDERDGDAKAILDARHGRKLLDGGTISLQSESHPCEFRNIRIKPLAVPAADRAAVEPAPKEGAGNGK